MGVHLIGRNTLQNKLFSIWERQQRIAIAIVTRCDITGAHHAAGARSPCQIRDIQLIIVIPIIIIV